MKSSQPLPPQRPGQYYYEAQRGDAGPTGEDISFCPLIPKGGFKLCPRPTFLLRRYLSRLVSLRLLRLDLLADMALRLRHQVGLRMWVRPAAVVFVLQDMFAPCGAVIFLLGRCRTCHDIFLSRFEIGF